MRARAAGLPGATTVTGPGACAVTTGPGGVPGVTMSRYSLGWAVAITVRARFAPLTVGPATMTRAAAGTCSVSRAGEAEPLSAAAPDKATRPQPAMANVLTAAAAARQFR